MQVIPPVGGRKAAESAAVLAQSFSNRRLHGDVNVASATEIAFSFLRHPGLQVACPGFAVLRMPLGRQAKSLLRSLVRLLLRHRFSTSTSGGRVVGNREF